ncbi:MAG: methylmalonyl Co-A mutase-associated GTPase MeaB [Syntrophales bacterium]|nr:methylmalonyl Co-A mutase-associated GTPase MeaB [Syntrophales bacterium]
METTKKIKGGDVRAASRLIRNLEDRVPEAKTTIKHLFPLTGKAHVIGITGSPGAGKSTLTDGLIDMFRKKGKTVGVLAVDPTSPFTGGAILGDRIRMQRHAEDPGVFVRSLATRGALGGLAKAVGDAIHVMDVLGKDIVIVETVGTGQQEVDIINHSHTVLVVLVPGMGDEIQAIKAGILEIADIFVVNKADREGSSKLSRELMAMLDMAPPSTFQGGWRPPIMKVDRRASPAPRRQGHHRQQDAPQGGRRAQRGHPGEYLGTGPPEASQQRPDGRVDRKGHEEGDRPLHRGRGHRQAVPGGVPVSVNVN